MDRAGTSIDRRSGASFALLLPTLLLPACGQGELLEPEDHPPPSVEEVEPDSIRAGTETGITVHGSGFDSSSVVRWDGSDRSTTFIGEGRLSARLERGDVSENGAYPVTVRTPRPGRSESDAVSVVVLPDGMIRGRIAVDDVGIPGVEVRLDCPACSDPAGSTEEDGEFLFEGLPSGAYTIEFQLPGISAVTFADSVRTIELDSDTSTVRADFEGRLSGDLSERGRSLVRGSVVDENGDPLAGVPITVRSTGDAVLEDSPYTRALGLAGAASDSTGTDPEGRFEVEIAPGDVEVEAHAPGRDEDRWLKRFQARDPSGGGSGKWVHEASISHGDTATADFAWVSCIAGTVEYREEVEVELTEDDCLLSGSFAREVWTFEGRQGDLVDVFTGEVWCSPVILLDPDTAELERDHHGCAGGELWVGATLPRDGTYYVVQESDNPLQGDHVERRPLFVDRTSPWSEVVAGGRHSCGVTPDGAAWCWGANGYGQLGDGTTEGSATPVPVTGDLSFESLSAGAAHTCGVATGGDLYCWGGNAEGQLGDGSTSSRSRPVRVASSVTFQSVDASLTGAHTCAVDAGGAAWCWGRNASGQLGDGSTGDALQPVRVDADVGFRAIAAGGLHSCALTDRGAPYCWGANGRGQLGDGTTESSSVPVRVAGELSMGEVSAGREHTCVIDPGAPVFEATHCWGGDDRLRPAAVTFGGKGAGLVHLEGEVSALSAGGDRSCVVLDHMERLDRIHCWEPGSDRFRWTGGWTAYASVSVGGRGGAAGHVCALRVSGAAHCWGDNASGQLGRGTRAESGAPRSVVPRPGTGPT